MHGFFIFIHTLVSVFLIIMILMQASTGGGLSGTFGGQTTSALFGGRSAATFLSKLTTWFAIAFMALAVMISLISSPTATNESSLLREEADTRVITPGADLSLPAALPVPEEDQ